MKLHSVIKDNILELSVQGIFQSDKEIQQFISQMNKKLTEYVEISFLDARMLPAEVITALKQSQQSGIYKKVTVTVFYRYLASYLAKLDIRHRYISQSVTSLCETSTFKALAIGGSAGSLDKILNIMMTVPKAPIVIFIVQHIVENSVNYLPNLIKDRTTYNVAQVEDGMIVEPGYIYIAPPGFHMLVKGNHIVLSSADKVNYSRPSISLLFESLAEEYKQQLLAILLCGYGADGSSAMQMLKDNKCTVIAEDPADCEAKDMLTNAIQTGKITYKFPLPEMVHYLQRVLNPKANEITATELQIFLTEVNDKYGYNYLNYEKASIKRRINRAMNDLCVYNFTRFREMVLADEEMFEYLFLEFSINVTEFFREPETYKYIKHEILPYLASFPHIKIWSAGCSTGMEPISLAISLAETNLIAKTQIYASDINPFVIEEARNGLYADSLLSKTSDTYLKADGNTNLADYFDINQGIMKVKDTILNKILYFQHSLLNPGSFHEFQLILCRNVLIYFDRKLQEQVFQLFAQSLDLNGFLVLGKSETISNTIPGFVLINKIHNIYQKVM